MEDTMANDAAIKSVKRQLITQIAEYVTYKIDAAWYARKPISWLENQLHLAKMYHDATTTLNADLAVRLATGAQNHAQSDTCEMCHKWIGHMGQLWAWKPVTEMYRGVNGGMCQTVPVSPWQHVSGYCLECASK